jgi:signal transduction histidine kinase
MSEALLAVPIQRADDVFVLRQRAREAAAAAGFEEVDQVRVATALSELGRELLPANGPGRAGAGLGEGRAAFSMTDGGTTLTVAVTGLPADAVRSGRVAAALSAARRLMDDVEHVAPSEPEGRGAGARGGAGGGGAGGSLILRKRLPAGRASTPDRVRAALAAAPTNPLDELRAQNRELIATLDELTSRRDELLTLNEELEETNRGVMAMYGQLADELAETNRGVVALYAELDEKSVELVQASEAKTRFLTSVSHELRSPVSSIIGLADLLTTSDVPFADDEQRRQVELISRSSGELLSLVDALLDLAKVESGRLEPDVGPLDLAMVLGELRGPLRPLVPPGVTLEIAVADDVVAVDTDRDLLVHVVRNLLTNALAFTERGTVRLDATMVSPVEVAITVSDTGVGIAPDDQDRIFEEFFQVKGPLQARRRGSGLGLPYARRVVHALGGTLGLRSEVGVGSTFTITLPVRWVESLARTTTPPVGSDALLGLEPVEVGLALVVDDDAGFRRILRGMLQGMAGQVIEATNGQEALDRMEAVRPDVVFLDLRMPDMDGSDVLARMEDLPVRDVPVVIVSSIDLSRPALLGLGRCAATLAKASLDRPLLAATLAAVVAGDTDAITELSSGEHDIVPAPLPDPAAPVPDPAVEP